MRGGSIRVTGVYKAESRMSATVEAWFAICAADVRECVALRDGWKEIEFRTQQSGVALPPLGRWIRCESSMLLHVRPQRLLVLSPPASPAMGWCPTDHPGIAVIDQSGGLGALRLGGPAARQVLERSCRLDLRRGFRTGDAAATMLVQISVTLAVLPSSYLILAGSTFLHHLCEWFEHQGVAQTSDADLDSVLLA